MIILSEKIIVTGHKSPDTDSICSSIAYAYLKKAQGVDAVAIRAGEINKETEFALNYFNVPVQPLVKSFCAKVGDVCRRDVEGLAITASLKDAAKWFAANEMLSFAPVVDNGKFAGVIDKATLADEFVKTVLGQELATVKSLCHDPEVFFKASDLAHDVQAGQMAPVVEDGNYVGVICSKCV